MRAFQVEGDVRGERVAGTAARFQFHRDHRADGRDFARKGQIQLPSGLQIILTPEVDLFMTIEGSHDREFADVPLQPGEQKMGQVQVAVDLSHIQIFRGPRVLLEVEGLHVTDRPVEIEQEHISGVSTRMHFPFAGTQPQRPNPFESRTSETHTTEPQQVAARTESLAYGHSWKHDVLLSSCRETLRC
jgi:hypothetical protein